MNKKIFILIPFLLFLTGCYNYYELNDLAIVSGISITYSNKEYEVAVEIVNPKKQQDATNSEEPDFIIYKKKDSSIQMAMRKMIEESPKKLYGAHLEVLIIDENIAKEHLKDIIDFFAREPEIRNEFYVLIGKDLDLLSITTPLENISSKNIVDSLKYNQKYLGYSNLVTFHDLISNYLNPNTELAISSIKRRGNKEKGENIKNLENTEKETSIIISGIGIFKNNKLIGYLENDDALVYNIIAGNANNFLIKTNLKNNNYIVNEVLSINTKIDVNIKEKKISITLKGKSSLVEENINNNLEDIKVMQQLKDKLNNSLENLIQTSILQNINKYHTDIYSFQNILYKKNPANIKKWNENILKSVKIEVKSNINIIAKGNLNGGVKHE